MHKYANIRQSDGKRNLFSPRLRLCSKLCAFSTFFGRVFRLFTGCLQRSLSHKSRWRPGTQIIAIFFCSLLDYFPLDLWKTVFHLTYVPPPVCYRGLGTAQVGTGPKFWRVPLYHNGNWTCRTYRSSNWTLLFIIFTRQWGSASAENLTGLRTLSCFCKTS